jgi:hypothetical protein
MAKKANQKPASGAKPAAENTVGQIVPKTAPAPAGAAPSPPVKPETPKEKGLLEKADELLQKGEIKVLSDAKNGIAGGIDSLVNMAGGGAAAKIIGEIGKGAVEILIPDNVIDIIPGGKVLSGGMKAAKLGKKGLEKLGKEAAEKAAKEAAEKAAKEAAEKAAKEAAEKAAKEAAEKGAKKADVAGNKGGHGKKKGKMKCGEGGPYGDLKKKTGEGKFDRDHIPSKAALLEKAKELNKGVDLNPDQIKKITNWGNSIAIPRKAHQDISPTYGGRNTPAADAKDLAGSAKRDVDTMLEKIDEYDADGGCKKAYKKASKKILDMTNDDYERELKKFLKKPK